MPGLSKSRCCCTVFATIASAACNLAWSDAPSGDELQEVVVTAQRREQDMQQVGIAITALSGDALQSLNITNTQDLAAQVPGLAIQTYSQAITSFSIRGVGQIDFGDQEEAPIAVYSDDAYNSYLGGVGGALFDVDRVEVLKGPQGTLFGRNATGGLINIISKRPTDDFEGYLSATGGSYSDRAFEGAVSGPLAENLTGRFAARWEKSDGYNEDLTTGHNLGGINNLSWRGQLLFKPLPGLSFLWNVRGMTDDTTGAAYSTNRAIFDPTGRVNNGLTYSPPSQAAYAAFCTQEFGYYGGGPQYGDCFGAAPNPRNPWDVNANNPGYFLRRQLGTTLHAEWTHDDLSVVWITDYNHLRKNYLDDTDASSLNLQGYFQNMNSRTISSELRAHLEESTFRLTAGTYYLNINGNYDTGFDYPQYGAYFTNPYTQNTESYAGFTQAEWDIVPTVTAIAGVRYTETKIDFDFVGECRDETATQFFLGCAGFGLPNQSVQTLGYVGNQSNGDYSAKAELDWHPDNTFLLYSALTRGNKAGGFNASPYAVSLLPSAVPFKPEVLTNAEIGFKSTLLDDRLRWNGNLYYYHYHNYQAFNLENSSPVVFNAQARVRGAETELQTAKVHGWEATVGVSLLKSVIYDILLPDGVTADQRMPFAPESTINVVLRKSWKVEGGEITLQGDANRRAAIFLNSINFPVLTDGPHTIANVSLEYRLDSQWQFRAFVTNIGDSAERTYCFDGSLFNGMAPCVYAPPRQFGGSVRFSW